MKKEKVLIACSGGPDSMALLDMYKNKYDVCVCHVNYHKRSSAKRDENIVKKYCKQYNIPFYKYDFKNNSKDNFQKLARDFRYDCFDIVCSKLNIKKVFVAHHLDDHIETYLMQIKRNTTVSYYGIAKTIKLGNITIYRPLLRKTKTQLLNYVDRNNIPYGIDESNLSDDYERNRIRHSKIDNMSYKDKKNILLEIDKRNMELKKELSETKSFIKKSGKYKINDFMSFKYFKRLIRLLLYLDLSDKYIEEIKKALISKSNIEMKIRNKYLCEEYGYIYVYDEPYEYSFSFNTIVKGTYDFFKIASKGSPFEGAFVEINDFPLTIRNFKSNDAIKMRYGTKKINRFFIDKKVSSFDRKIWPIVLNKKGEVILVPGIGCNINHYSPKNNLYVLKLSYYGEKLCKM